MNRFVEAFLTGAGLYAVNTSSKTLTIIEINCKIFTSSHQKGCGRKFSPLF
jgi:hypothetical protein